MNKEALSTDQVDKAAVDELKREQVRPNRAAHSHIIDTNFDDKLTNFYELKREQMKPYEYHRDLLIDKLTN